MIPFGAFHPDSAGVNSPACLEAMNCIPTVVTSKTGPVAAFAPERAPVAVSDALPAACIGMASIVQNTGIVVQFAGTADSLYRLDGGQAWTSVGSGYATIAGERWRFAGWNPYVLATNYNDNPQWYDTSLTTPTWVGIPGTPPRARFIGSIRNQVVLAGLYGQENALQFSGYNNASLWTIGGTGGADIQKFPDGGPITGFVGGTVGYVFQASKISRMTPTTDAAQIFQIDEVAAGGNGCIAPNSIVRVGDTIFFMSSNGFYQLSISTGALKPIGFNKWREWFRNDYAAGTEALIIGAADPLNPVVRWCYKSKGASGAIQNRMLIYDWSLDEASFSEVAVEAISNWLSSSVTLDTMTPFGTLDTLPYSLDSPFWKAGVPLISVIDANHKLNYLQGSPLAAQWITTDGMTGQREFVIGAAPMIDTSAATVAIAMRERIGDTVGNAVTFPPQEAMEDTGWCSAWASGNVARACIQTAAGANWTFMSGVRTNIKGSGAR